MPIYEYRCRSCKADFEELIRSQDAADPACPQCGSRKVDRRLSVFAARNTEASAGAAPAAAGPCGHCENREACGF